MRDAARWRSMPVRLTSLVAFVALALAGYLLPSLPGQTADPAKPLAANEQQKPEVQATQLNEAGRQAYQQGDLVKAVEKIKELLQVRETLYPKDRYPQGHPDLAQSLHNLGGLLLQAQGSYGEATIFFVRARTCNSPWPGRCWLLRRKPRRSATWPICPDPP